METLIFLGGISLDGFIYVMQIGATVRDLNWKQRFKYAGVYALTAIAMALVGFGCSGIAKSFMSADIERITAIVTMALLGIVIATRAYSGVNYEEKLDKTFNVKRMVLIAIVTNIDTLLLGSAFNFFQTPLLYCILTIGICSIVLATVALTVGYNLGAAYQKQIGMIGGGIMVVCSLVMLFNYLRGY